MNSPITSITQAPRMFKIHTDFEYDGDVWTDNLPALLPGLLTETPRRGDMLQDLSFGGFRNEGKAIFDGEKWHELDNNIDEYGALPPFICYPEFPLGSHLPFISTNWISWITIDDQVIREISELQLVYKKHRFEGNWHVVGTLLGKPVCWELFELEGDEEDDTQAKACLENLCNLVAARCSSGKPLAVSYHQGEICGFKAVYTPTCIYTIEQQPDFGEDF